MSFRCALFETSVLVCVQVNLKENISENYSVVFAIAFDWWVGRLTRWQLQRTLVAPFLNFAKIAPFKIVPKQFSDMTLSELYFGRTETPQLLRVFCRSRPRTCPTDAQE